MARNRKASREARRKRQELIRSIMSPATPQPTQPADIIQLPRTTQQTELPKPKKKAKVKPHKPSRTAQQEQHKQASRLTVEEPKSIRRTALLQEDFPIAGIRTGNQENLEHEGKPENLKHTGNVANLNRKGNVANLNRKGRKKGSKNKQQRQQIKDAKRKARAQRKHPQPEPSLIDYEAVVFHIYDAIVDAINNAPTEVIVFSKTGRGQRQVNYVELDTQKQQLLSILDDTIANASDEVQLFKYYESRQEEIFEALDALNYASSSDQVEQSFAFVAKILKHGRALSKQEATNLSAYA